MRRIYVAGGSDERFAVRVLIENLLMRGWEVTHDWTRDPGYDAPPTDSQRKRSAHLDLAAIVRAEVVWVVAPQNRSEGAAVEFGFACGLDKKAIVSGPCADRCIFWLHADHVFDSHADALAWLGFADPLDPWRSAEDGPAPTVQEPSSG